MKNEKGFTLVELLATIMIIIVLMLLISPKLIQTINKNRNKGYLEIETRLEEAAAKYILNEYISSDINSLIITKEELINSSYIEEVYDLKDKSICDAYVYVYDLNKTPEFNSVIDCSSYETKDKNGVGYIQHLLSNEEELNNGLFVDDTADKNIRYRGANPNNYVYFNCKDKDSNNIDYGEEDYDYASSCEVWRIIGVFDTKASASDTEGEKRVKLVREQSLGIMSWDSSASTVNSGYGINEWSQADLQTMLNGYYIGKEGATCTYCNGENQGTCENNCSSSVTPLSTTSLNMIEEALWYTGAQTWADPMTLSMMYNGEIGTQNGKICSSTSTNSEGLYVCTDNVIRTTTWEGLVGLIYPSDYGYASIDVNCANDIYGENSTCENNNWLHPTSWYWTISPLASSGHSTIAWVVGPSNSVSHNSVRYAGGVRPAAYLSSNIQITGGDGTNTTPFKLGI